MNASTTEPSMIVTTVGVQELREQTEPILRRVAEQGETIVVVDEGKPLARLESPGRQPVDQEALAAWWAEVDALAAEIGAHWPEGVSADDAIRDIRREL